MIDFVFKWFIPISLMILVIIVIVLAIWLVGYLFGWW